MKSNALYCLVKTCTLLCMVAISFGSVAQSKILLYDDCEATNKPNLNGGGYPPTSWGMKQGDPSNPLVRSTEAARKGTASYKVQVNNNATSGYFYCKSELVWNFLPAGSPLGTVGNYSAYYYQPLNLRWVAASIMIPTYNNDFNTPTGIGFNTKCVEDDWGSGTTFALQMYQGRYRIMVAKVTKSGTTYSWAWANGGAIDMGPVVKGQWEDWVLNRNFTSDPATGFIRFYKNGKLMFEHIGGNWYDDGKHSKEPYMQMGLYKWAFDGYSPAPDVNQVTMFMDEIRMGTDQASLNDFLLDAAQVPANQAPVANAGTNKSITLPVNSISLTGTGTDSDGTITSYSWSQTAGPNNATITNGKTATATFSNLIEGTYTFRLTVADNSGATGSANVTVTVNPQSIPNQAPIANAGADKNITLPTNSTSLSGSGTDSDGTISAFRWTQVSGPGTSTFGSENAANTSVSELIAGTYTYRLTVTDNNGATSSDDILVTVNPAPVVNQAPIANAGSNQSITLPTSTVNLTGSASDADGIIASYRWTQTAGPNISTIATGNSAGTNISGLIAGTYTFRLTVTDNDGATGVDDVTVTVNAAVVPNQVPVANAGNNLSITLPASSVTITGSATDADGTIASYRWSQVSGPNTAVIGSGTSASSLFSGLVQGSYTFRLTVADNDGATDADDVSVTVNPAPAAPQKKAPVAKAGGKKSITGASTKIDGTASYDPDGQIVSYSWAQDSGPSQATIVSAKSATTDVTNLSPGTYTFKLTVADNDAMTAAEITTVLVAAAPIAPKANAGANITITLPTNTTALNGSASTDPDGTILSYKWTQVSGPNTATLASSTNSTTLVTNMMAGSYQFNLEVTDNQGLKNSASVTVLVNPQPANKLPVIVTETAINIMYPADTVMLDGSKSYDTDGKIKLYQWKMVNGPSKSVLTSQNTAVAKAANLLPGVYTFQLLIRDDRNGTVTKDVNVTITDPGNRSTVSLKLYPNPVSSSGTLNVRLDDNNLGTATLKIYTMSGVVVLQDVINKQSIHFNKSINVSNFMSGTYVMLLQFENQAPVTRKFQKL